jgi:hypothetical protein
MSALTKFQPNFTTGHLRYHIDSDKQIDGYLRCDGSIASVSAYPKLAETIGFIKDGEINFGTLRNSNTTSIINTLTYGNGIYVYAGNGGVLATSTNGVDWTLQTSGTTSNINALTYGNGTFVYAGVGGVLRTSTNGITWTARTSGTTSNINALTYGNGTFVYAGVGGVLRTSTNGVDWTLQTSGTTSNINTLAYGNGTFVYGNDNSVVGTSVDGVTWTINSLSELYVGGKTFARGGNTTTTNISLTDLTGGANTAPQTGDLVVIAVAMAAGNVLSQAVTGYTEIASLYVDDNIDTNLWVGYKVMGSTPDTTVTIPSSGSLDRAQTVAIHVWRNVEFADSTTLTRVNTAIPDPPSITVSEDRSVVLVVGAAAHQDGTDTFSTSYASNFITVGFNAVGDSTIGMGSVFRTFGGVYNPPAFSFSGSDSTINSCAAVSIYLRQKTNSILAAEYGNGTFVIAGRYGDISTSSTNGVTWISRTSGTTSDIKGLSYNNLENLFAYVAADGSLRTSTNGITWTARTSGTPLNLNTIFSNGPFIYAGSQGVLGTLSSYTYNPNLEFLLPTSSSIFELNSEIFNPTTFIKI